MTERRFQTLDIKKFFLADGRMGLLGKGQQFIREYRWTRKQLEKLKRSIEADLSLGLLE